MKSAKKNSDGTLNVQMFAEYYLRRHRENGVFHLGMPIVL